MAQGNPFDQFDAAPGPQVVIPVSPTVAAKDAADLARVRQQTRQDVATAPYDAAKAAADARTAAANATKAERDLQAQQTTASPAQQRLMANLANDEILGAVAKARADLSRFGATGLGARLPEFAQTQGAIDLSGSLNTIASRLTLDKLAQLKQSSPTGASGLGSLTEREGALLRDSVAGLGQTQSTDRLLENLAAVEKHYRNFMALTAGEDYRDPAVAARYGITSEPTGGSTEPAQQLQFTQGGVRDEADPALKGVNAHVRGMIGAGRSAGDIIAYMNEVKPGLGTQRAADVLAVTKFRAQNPNVPLSRYEIVLDRREVPMSGTAQVFNAAAQAPLGAYAMGAGDAVTGGLLDNLFDNPAEARAGMAAVAAQNPAASFTGSLTGGAVAGALAEGAVAGAGLRWAPRIADAAYGALYGAGSADEGSRLEGAGWGAASGIAGGALGRRAGRALGGSLRGVDNPDAQLLRERGVPLTYGQIRGGGAKALEDRYAGFAGIGESIAARRRAGFEGFNRAAFNDALAPIGRSTADVGEEGVAQAREMFRGPNGAYAEALGDVSLTPDRRFIGDVTGALEQGSTLPRVGTEFQAFIDRNVAPHFEGSVSPIRKVGNDDGWDKYLYKSRGEEIPFEIRPPQRGRTGIEISIDENNVYGANRLGTVGMRKAASHLKSLYPDADYIYGTRTSGAGPGRQQLVDMAAIKPAPTDGAPPKITGAQVQDIIQQIRGANFGNDSMGGLATDAARGVEGAVMDLAGRQAPGSMEALGNANTAYRNFNVTADAVGRAANTGGIFTPAQLGTAARMNTNRFGGRVAAATPDRPFFDLQRAAQNVLPSAVPDSGTAGRADIAGEGITAIARRALRNARLAPLYAEGTQPAINAALLDRPDWARTAGRAIEGQARRFGLFGRPLALGYGPLAVSADY